jgi:3',5'-cyclic AMP phosphodiesterase CpdA
MGGVTFIILDNAISYIPTLWWRSTQYQWLTDVLSMPREGPLFVAMHKPPFDPRPARQHHGMEDEAFAEALMRGFTRAGVDAVFTGHIHASHRWVRDGIPYVVSGEGFTSPAGSNRNRMAWVHVCGWQVTIAQISIWGPAYAESPSKTGVEAHSDASETMEPFLTVTAARGACEEFGRLCSLSQHDDSGREVPPGTDSK